jgi:ribosomal-protein-alanine N-acetyltransferase
MLKLPWARKNNDNSKGICFVIKPMWLNHIHRVVEIEEQSFGEPWIPQAFRHCICSREHGAFVSLIENRVAGYAVTTYSAGSHQLCSIAVAPEYRRMGVARCMIMQQLALLGGAKQMLAGVSDKNLPAHQFLRSMGFCAISIGSRFFSNGDDAYIFQWKVGAQDRYLELRHPDYVLPDSHKHGVPVVR